MKGGWKEGVALWAQAASLIQAPLSTLSPDVLNTWCTDSKAEQSVRNKEDWKRNKAEHNDNNNNKKKILKKGKPPINAWKQLCLAKGWLS